MSEFDRIFTATAWGWSSLNEGNRAAKKKLRLDCCCVIGERIVAEDLAASIINEWDSQHRHSFDFSFHRLSHPGHFIPLADKEDEYPKTVRVSVEESGRYRCLLELERIDGAYIVRDFMEKPCQSPK